MTDSKKKSFESVFRVSWLEVAAILLIAVACPVVYARYKLRTWRECRLHSESEGSA